MDNQRDHQTYEALKELIAEKNPPTADRMKVILEGLRRFPLDVVKKAAMNLLDDYEPRTFPSRATIVKECERISKQPAESSSYEPGTGKFPWEQRDDKRRALEQNAFLELIRTPLWQDAHAQGWDSDLERYCRELFCMQATIIVPSPNNGVSGNFSLLLDIVSPSQYQVQNFITKWRQMLTSGVPVLEIPSDLIDRWKSRAKPPSESIGTDQYTRSLGNAIPSSRGAIAKSLNQPPRRDYFAEREDFDL